MGRWWCFLRLAWLASQSSLSCVEELGCVEAQQPVDYYGSVKINSSET